MFKESSDKNALLKKVNRILIQKIDTKDNKDFLLKNINRILIETVELTEMSHKIISLVLEELHLKKAALMLVEDKKISGWFAEGFTDLPPNELALLVELDSMLVQEELAPGETKELLKKFEISIIVPLRVKEKEIGILILGNKLSGEVFSEEDALFFEIISSEMAIGIQNAKSYSEIKKLSEELEKRVIERTKQLEKSQKEEIAKTQEVARLKDEFVFLAVHELRTPVTAIRGFLELTEDAQKDFPKDIQEKLQAISQASTHVNQLINDILEIARSENGTSVIEVKSNDFKSILDGALHEVASLIEQKGLKLNVKVDSVLPVLCDAPKLKEVLLNLVGNAIKYNRDNGTVDISVYQVTGEKYIMFEIRDTGYGIPKDQQSKIFQKFFRAVTHETQEVLGTGLGLFITRMLIEKMGGKLMFSSVEHQGTTFSFTLPIV